jgi:hypothetical protein
MPVLSDKNGEYVIIFDVYEGDEYLAEISF